MFKRRKNMADPFKPDFDQLTQELEKEAGILPVARAPTSELGTLDIPPTPDYVEHDPEVGDLGKLTAQAVAAQFEAAAKTIEAMGKELVQVAADAEKMANGVKDAIKYIEEVASHYREEAKTVFARIEQAVLKTQRVRAACDDAIRRLQDADHNDQSE